MVYNDTTTKAGIIQLIESLCSLGIGGITSNTNLFYRVTADVNLAYKKVASALLTVDKKWNWDDSNYTDFPRGVGTLVSSQQDYTLPAATAGGNAATLLRLIKIAVLDKNTTPQERILTLTDRPEADLNNQYSADALPLVYKLIGNSVKMWPSPDNNVTVTLTNGLIVYYQRTPVPFDTSTTNAVEPGFIGSFHDILAYEAAGTYLLPQNPNLATTYLQLASQKLDQLLDAYTNKNAEIENRMIPVYRSSR